MTTFFDEEIVMKIKRKREEMIRSANRFGYTNESTIHFSQQLDELINEYLQNNENEQSHEIQLVYKSMTMVLQKPFNGTI